MENAFTVCPREGTYGAPSYRFAPTSNISMYRGQVWPRDPYDIVRFYPMSYIWITGFILFDFLQYYRTLFTSVFGR